MAKCKERGEVEVVVVPVPDVETFAINDLEVLSRPVVECWVIF